MPLLQLLVLMTACLPVVWPSPLGLSPAEAAGMTLGAALGLLGATRLVTGKLARRVAWRSGGVVDSYGRWRFGLQLANLAALPLLVVAGWGEAVQTTLCLPEAGGEWSVAPGAELALILPYLLVQFGMIALFYDVERAFHLSRGGDESFWTRGGYLGFQMRLQALFVLLPVALIVGETALARLFPDEMDSDLARAGPLLVLPAFMTFLPLVIPRLLSTRPLEPGALRDRLEALNRRWRVGCRDLLVWPTRHSLATALVVGVLPRWRYVIFTDRLLEELTPTEIEAVCGHEAGHAYHRHLWLYALFMALSAVLIGLLDEAGRGMMVAAGYSPGWWFDLLTVPVLALYLFVVFGLLSRGCERQADIHGCRTAGPGELSPEGIETFARALERVGAINGGPRDMGRVDGWRDRIGAVTGRMMQMLQTWQHGSIERRAAYLRTLVGRPELEQRFQGRLFALKCALVACLLAAIAAGVWR